MEAASSIQKLKFRTFSSKEKEGFIIYSIGPQLPLLILEDILFQLFQPLFPHLMCPQIYFFSSTDQILKIQDLPNIQDFVYVHFLERIQKYKRDNVIQEKLKLGLLDVLAQGIGIKGTNLYIFSEKQYMMYAKDIFLRNTLQFIQKIDQKQDRKQILYTKYVKELQFLKDNAQMISLKNQLKQQVQNFSSKVQNLQLVHSRYLKAKTTLLNVLQMSGINIKTLDDLT